MVPRGLSGSTSCRSIASHGESWFAKATWCSAGRGGRTLMGRSPRDFESRASAGSAIPAVPPADRVQAADLQDPSVARSRSSAYIPADTGGEAFEIIAGRTWFDEGCAAFHHTKVATPPRFRAGRVALPARIRLLCVGIDEDRYLLFGRSLRDGCARERL